MWAYMCWSARYFSFGLRDASMKWENDLTAKNVDIFEDFCLGCYAIG